MPPRRSPQTPKTRVEESFAKLTDGQKESVRRLQKAFHAVKLSKVAPMLRLESIMPKAVEFYLLGSLIEKAAEVLEQLISIEEYLEKQKAYRAQIQADIDLMRKQADELRASARIDEDLAEAKTYIEKHFKSGEVSGVDKAPAVLIVKEFDDTRTYIAAACTVEVRSPTAHMLNGFPFNNVYISHRKELDLNTVALYRASEGANTWAQALVKLFKAKKD